MANKDRQKLDEQELIPISEAAKALGVTEATVRRWCRNRAINYVEVGPFKLKKISAEELARQRKEVHGV